ncbi:pirin family protein [Arenibacter sp. TNZ]|uniref:pirin family protein n=1 Tax=Arenibacter TaxID=178469 RepID=UPI000CD43F70|nr:MULTISPECIES: pirin family protein [Arenibacter]MCM4173245.1 pirin family protein [Arenibacter sp. TNZ]
MKTILYTSDSRGHANHGWLNSYHSFSFANYHNPEKMNFGVLRVLNDDTVSGGQGFGQHPHKNMEIISIPLQGDLEHKDSMGNSTVIKEGDVQAMSAGTGVFHSEYNKNKNEEVKFLQIWVIPKTQNVTPRYDQISTHDLATKNSFYQILSPNKTDQGVWIHQDAWFSLGDFETGISSTYTLNKNSNGLFLFVLEGGITINEQQLKRRDAIGISETNEITLISTETSKVLLMEVPMEF